MNQSPFIAVAVCATITHFTIGAEPTNELNRKRPRKEINRVEPPGASESQPGKETAVGAELCNEAGDVKYSAVWQKGRVTLTASGSHTTGGYRTFFEQSMLMIYPPEFSLKHQRPSGPATQAIAPFSVQTSFKADEKPQAITVHDAKGRQRVPVR